MLGGSFSFAKSQQVLLDRNYKPVRITQQKEHLMWNSETTQSLNIYLYNYQTETAIFLGIKHAWKNNYGMQLFKFFNTENTSKQQKMVVYVMKMT